ncbi:MAG: UDP-glucose/GDP-mannose dehydrogenase family protein [Endomicrobiales bacterium]|nr:UDP-glucose/GDP-mannose dehydrogenase family protein [Endomicrobiales bacterium]
MRKIAIVGSGYVGLVTGTCLAELGHKVVCVDNNKSKIELLKKGQVPIYEPGLEALIRKNTRSKRLSFSTDLAGPTKASEIIFIAVNTPPKPDGSVDLYYVEAVAREIAQNMTSYKLIVDKSTVPVETAERVELTIKRNLKKNVPFDIASNPEFLREGSALDDTFHPDRIVIGVNSPKAEKMLKEIYSTIKAPVLVTDIKSAEIIKHASNSFLALKISFINAVANICEKSGANIVKVAEGMGLDKRIGKAFLNAGIGFGGSCFPKDLSGFLWISKKLGYDFKLLEVVKEINESQKHSFVKKIEDNIWILKDKTIAVLGLSFKPDTDDMRSAPSIDIIKMLVEQGAKVRAYDPVAMKRAKETMPSVYYARDAYDAVKNADCLAVVTEWDAFKRLDYKMIKKLMKSPTIIDGRNLLDPKTIKSLGFVYRAIGGWENSIF